LMLGDWSADRVSLLKKLRNVDELTASQCAKVLGVTRNAIIGKVHRLDLDKRVVAAKQKGGNGSAGKYRGVITAARKARAARIAPDRIKLPPADVFRPAAEDIAVGAWAALPGTEPVTLEALGRTGCRWPIGEDAPFLFCGCEAAAGSSYCPTHKHRATGKGTTGERQATRSLAVVARFEVKNGFRGRQAGTELPG
jgi:GcrA cell cycle regulator